MSVDHGARLAAKLTLDAFDAFAAKFETVTRRARQRFEDKDWQGARRDASERLDSYEEALDRVANQLEFSLGGLAREHSLWAAARELFAALVAGRYDVDRAETFFNSATRKMLRTVGINREVEFFYLHPKTGLAPGGEEVCRTYTKDADTRGIFRTVLAGFSFGVGYEDIDRDAELLAQEVDLHLWPTLHNEGEFSIDIVRAIFFRNKEAYIVGRIVAGGEETPLIIPLVNGESGIYADAVLLHESEASIVFSFAYSSFFVDVQRHDALIEFLRSILPRSEVAELYASLGYNRHGKTEFYRDLHRFVHVAREQFIIAPGQEGAVMIVFTLPNYGFVFKVIKDRPCFLRSRNDTPKAITREKVRHQYDFVAHRDRAGRMVDTQEFESLRFRRKRFSDGLLEEFGLAAKATVTVTDEYVVLGHAYVQKKVIPLPLYFQSEKDPEALRHVLIDFGYFLKDIASGGVFPCDLFNTWNYGVTHWGRVVLYDYDDVVPIERVTFREKRAPRDEQEEVEPEEDWIFATEEDFFMDEMDRYSGIPGPLKGIFNAVHGDLYSVAFWHTLKEKVQQGVVSDVVPYERNARFHGGP